MVVTPAKLSSDIALKLQTGCCTGAPHSVCISDVEICNSWKRAFSDPVPPLNESEEELCRLNVPDTRCVNTLSDENDASTAAASEASSASTSEVPSRQRSPATPRELSRGVEGRRGKSREHGHRRCRGCVAEIEGRGRRLSEPVAVSTRHREDPPKMSFDAVEVPHTHGQAAGISETLTVEGAQNFMDKLSKFTRCGGHSTLGITGGPSIQDSKVLQESLRQNKFLPPTFFLTDAAQRENLRLRIRRQNEFVDRRLVEMFARDHKTERAPMITPRTMKLFKDKDKWKQECADVHKYISRRVVRSACKRPGSE